MQLRELHQQCYSKSSEKSWNIGNTALKWAATINVSLNLQQNSVTWLAEGPGMCYIIKYITLSDDTYNDLRS
jgi:hypothetical protein